VPRVDCPSCGATVQLSSVARSADEFCPTPGCDYPLFWAPVTTQYEDIDAAPAGEVVRRRPGTGGRELLSPEPCPACREPNRPSAVFCHRCGAEMHPAPAPPDVLAPRPPALEAPPSEPAPPPPVLRRLSPWLDWRVIAVLVVLLVILMLTGSLVLLSRA
jgi:2-polyprenyl-6-methoxyphenol hydroxylase-like FAD-dependent oxidoreductase